MTSNDFYCDFVLNQKISIDKIHETNNVLAYKHTNPSWPIHYVVIPKQHIKDIYSCPNWLITELIDVVRKVALKVEAKYGACRILTNIGNYQDSKHLHWHLYVEQNEYS